MLTKQHIDYRSHDKDFWEEELEDWVPRRIYDCHMHLLNNDLIAGDSKNKNLYPDTDFKTAKQWHDTVLPNWMPVRTTLAVAVAASAHAEGENAHRSNDDNDRSHDDESRRRRWDQRQQ